MMEHAMLAAISIGGLVNLLIYIIVIGLILWLALYVISQLPLPEPFGAVARIVVIVIAVLLLILLLLQLVGGGVPTLVTN